MKVGGLVQDSRVTRNFFGKSSQNSSIPAVLIFWVSYHVYFLCLHTFLKDVSHYDSSVLSMLVMDLKQK